MKEDKTDTDQNNTRLNSERSFLPWRNKDSLPSLKAHLIFWPLMAAGFALDLWTKAAVFNWLEKEQDNSALIIDGFLRFVQVLNDGSAFGLFSGRPNLLTAASIIALIMILVIFLSSKTQHYLVHIALALFAAGICGNLYDRIFNEGLVRDFIDVYYHQYHWPAFNIADALLCIGVGVLILSTFITGKSNRTRGRPHK